MTKAIVVGAGIGGMTAALALRAKGVEVQVLEQAETLKEIGAGIQIAANGAIVMRHLGLGDALEAAAVKPLSYDYRELETGRMLIRAPLGPEAAARYGAPLYNIHRADLIAMLFQALPAGTVRLGAKCTGFEQDNAGAQVRLASGETLRADALIGADGIHSAVRRHLRGEEQTHFANLLMWRALIPAARIASLALEERGNYWTGPGRTIISYWVRPGNLYSLLAAVPVTEVHRESWAESGDVGELRRSFHGAEPRVTRMLEEVDSSFITGMYYRDPADWWTRGRISLLGDAAHPMVPYLAQGACQAMEDAWTLATCLAKASAASVPQALQEYETRRRPRTTRVQAGARAMVKLVHESDAGRIRSRNGRWKGMMRIDPLGETTWAFVWDYNVLKAVEEPAGNVLGLTALREGKRMQRPESQRAFDLWKNAFTQEDIARGHDGLREAYDRFLLTNFPPPADLKVAALDLEGVAALQVSGGQRPGAAADAPTVLHFHGGGYMIGSARASVEYAGRLARAVGGCCVTVEYRLAPEHPYPAALIDAMEAYRALLGRGIPASSIILSGESSGGGLALALALALRGAGDPLPAGLIAICPFADLTLRGASVKQFSGDDPAAHRDSLTYMAASYFQAHEPTDPLVSPVFGSLAGLPPMFISATQGEVLESDATRLAEQAKADGADVTLHLVPDSVHVFTVFPFLPEARTTLQQIGRWTAERARPGSVRARVA